MRRSQLIAVAMAFATIPSRSEAQPATAVELLIREDVRLASVAERLMAANSHLCRQTMPLTGIILHSRDQYRSDVGDSFARGPVAIAAIVPKSPADGLLAAGDGLAAIGAQRTDMLRAEGKAPLRDSAFELLAAQSAENPVSLAVVRGGEPEAVVQISALKGCRALVEIRSENGLGARSDGRVIQVNYGLATAASEDQLAVIFAHELGHVVLDHRLRLSAAGVSKGFFGEFGRNQQLNRQVEIEADRISVHLLANAGYDPAIAAAFWRTSLGRNVAGGALHSRNYPSPEERARLIEREIADYLAGAPGPSYPGHLLARREAAFR